MSGSSGGPLSSFGVVGSPCRAASKWVRAPDVAARLSWLDAERTMLESLPAIRLAEASIVMTQGAQSSCKQTGTEPLRPSFIILSENAD